MHHAHDKFVKEKLSEKKNAIDFLRVAMPEKVLSKIDLNSLEPSPDSFITKDMKELFSDIVFSCKLENGQEAYCNILIEHKSYKDPELAFQLLDYISGIYRYQMKNKMDLRPVIPLVFYHHEKQWKYKSIEDHFAHFPGEFHKFIPKFDIVLFDVKSLPDDFIISIRNVAIRSMLITQKHIHNPEELIQHLERIYESLQTNEERNNFHANFVYIMMVSKKEDNIIEIIKKDKDKPLNRFFMSIYEELTIENIKKGKIEKQIEVVLALNEDNIPVQSIAKYTRLTVEQVVEILKKHNRDI